MDTKLRVSFKDSRVGNGPLLRPASEEKEETWRMIRMFPEAKLAQLVLRTSPKLLIPTKPF
jgi:hypothetical protein